MIGTQGPGLSILEEHIQPIVGVGCGLKIFDSIVEWTVLIDGIFDNSLEGFLDPYMYNW